ncbi:formate dehydrogenase accessory sulfurtransferase FdhD [Cryobacterium sp. Y11]|uniref:formate dehydrogenase accessory sulfurtransferase FdhD n=1 Tax=Cryobacterium sp. Y11 TaxID=2045016 RepID=UPI000CE441AE
MIIDPGFWRQASTNCAQNRLSFRDTVLTMSSRTSVELTHKATMASVSMLASVLAPPFLAVELTSEGEWY